MAGDDKADRGQLDHLKAELAKAIGACDTDAMFNTMKAFRLKIAGIILGGVTTVLIGASHIGVLDGYGGYLSLLALVTSTAVAGFTTWEIFFSYRDRWSSFTEAAQRLRRVSDELGYATAAAAGITQPQLDAFFKRYQVILQDAHAGWLSQKASPRK